MTSRQDVGNARWEYYNVVMHWISEDSLTDNGFMVWTGLFGETSDYLLFSIFGLVLNKITLD